LRRPAARGLAQNILEQLDKPAIYIDVTLEEKGRPVPPMPQAR
jgi:hypothetical protein